MVSLSFTKFVLLAFALGAAAHNAVPSGTYQPGPTDQPHLSRRGGSGEHGGYEKTWNANGWNQGSPSHDRSNEKNWDGNKSSNRDDGKKESEKSSSNHQGSEKWDKDNKSSGQKDNKTPADKESKDGKPGKDEHQSPPKTTPPSWRDDLKKPDGKPDHGVKDRTGDKHESPSGTTQPGGGDHGGRAKGKDDKKTTTEKAPHPVPSKTLHSRRNAKKRKDPADMSGIEIAQDVCPKGLFGCPIVEPGSLSSLPANHTFWFTEGFECFDLQVDLKACGGCAAVDPVHDCTTIPGSRGVTCDEGTCVVQSCADGYTLDRDENVCVRD